MSKEHTGLPNTPEEIRAFIGKSFSSLQFGQDNELPHENDTYTLTAHDLISAFQWAEIDAPMSAEPTDDEIIDIAVEPLGIDCDRMPYGVVVFARALLSRYSSAPVATQAQLGEDIIVNCPDNVYTLPLRSSGLTQGPRFVVHVPAQTSASAELECSHCGGTGDVSGEYPGVACPACGGTGKAAPVAAQPDLTQQTLDDVMAGIPARDAEIEALRKQVETLQAQLVDRSPEMQGKPVDESPILQGQQQPASNADGLPLILHDLNTSAGGRGFVAEYFESRVGRYDFTRYIRDRLAADFACALAAHLSQQDVLQAEVLDMVRMLEANEWADHCGQSELGKRLEWAITALQNRPQNIPEIIPEPAQRLIFPTMLRKMWSGSEVQAWLDDELAKLTKLSKLSSQQVTDKTDAGHGYNDGFSDGVILALQLMTMHGDYNGTQYCELFNAAGPNQIVERAIREGMWEMSGLSQTPAAVERRAAIEAARKEPGQ
ncbi:DnaJ-like cysteine-rich domain-containing protein [Alcaligenes nematophilus]|uniref:hypothetical protein n=1 Tax=Alcaligenes nematophilus TaxID=2994643 RepID=UPI003850BBA8